MICPHCGSTQTDIILSYPSAHNTRVRRRRCFDCDGRWHTIESQVADEHVRPSYADKGKSLGVLPGFARKVVQFLMN